MISPTSSFKLFFSYYHLWIKNMSLLIKMLNPLWVLFKYCKGTKRNSDLYIYETLSVLLSILILFTCKWHKQFAALCFHWISLSKPKSEKYDLSPQTLDKVAEIGLRKRSIVKSFSGGTENFEVRKFSGWITHPNYEYNTRGLAVLLSQLVKTLCTEMSTPSSSLLSLPRSDRILGPMQTTCHFEVKNPWNLKLSKPKTKTFANSVRVLLEEVPFPKR